jgi:hypothetical protein
MRLHTNLTRQSITLSYRMLLGAGFLARWPNDPAIYVRHVSTMLLELRRLRAEERQRAEMKAGRCE